MIITKGQIYTLRNGRQVMVTSTTCGSPYPILGEMVDGNKNMHTWPDDNNGRFYEKKYDRECQLDIMSLSKVSWDDV